MTKLEYLQSTRRAEPCKEILYTWKAQGSLTADNGTKIYLADSLYLIQSGASALNNCLLYCSKEYRNGSIDWSRASVYDSDSGYITFGGNIVNNAFTLLLDSPAFVSATDSYDPSEYAVFTPYKGLNASGQVAISEDDYGLCLKPLGYPFVTEDELEYSREEIIRYAVKPALEEYFHWIPNTRPSQISVSSSEMDVAMPDDAYCVVGISLQQYGTGAVGNVMSPLFYAMEQSLYGGYSFASMTGTYTGSSPFTNTGTLATMLDNQRNAQALINLNRRVHYEGPYTIDTQTLADSLDSFVGGRYIKVYSNSNGVFNIWWGIRTLDFNDVEFAERTRVIEYAQACVKELFGSVRALAKSDIPGQPDYGKWLTEAATAKNDIRTEWKNMVKYAGIMRGSL